jgi:hypothetical protein
MTRSFLTPRTVVSAAGFAVACVCTLGTQRGHAQTTATWLNPVNGSWNDPTRWSTNPDFPNNSGPSTFNAVIGATGAAYNVDLNVPITVQNVNISSADATLRFLNSNNLTINQALGLSAGSELLGQAYTGELRVRGKTTFSGTQVTGLGMSYMDGGADFTGPIADDINDTCVIHGANGSWTGNRDINFGSNSGIMIRTGSTFNIASSGSIIWDQTGTYGLVYNAGTIIRTGAGTTNFTNVTYDNTGGTLDVRGGTLSMNNYSITGNTLAQGAWKVSGSGNLDLQGVTVLTNSADVTLDGASSQFGAFAGVTSNTGSGKITISGGRSFTTAGNFTNNGRVVVEAASSFTVLAGSSLTNYNAGTGTLSGGIFDVRGTLKFDNTGINTLDAAITLTGAGSQLSTTSNGNALSGVSRITTNGALAVKGGKSFTLSSNITVEGNNSGIIEVDDTSEFIVDTGFSLLNYDLGAKRLSQGDFRIAGKFQFQHSGIEILDSKLTLDGALAQVVDAGNVDALEVLNTIDGFGAFTLANNAAFTANPSDAPGFTFTVASTGRIDIADGSQLDILGDLANYSGGTFTNGDFAVSGTLRARNITNITTVSTPIGLDSATSLITNFTNTDVFATVNLISATGRFRVSNGRNLTLTDPVGVLNQGSLTIGRATGGGDTATLTILNDYTQSGVNPTTTVQNGGKLIVSGQYTMLSGSLSIFNGQVIVGDSFNFSGGTVGLGAGGQLLVNGAFNMTGGNLALSGGALDATSIIISGGELTGNGSVNGDLVIGGVLSPGGGGARRGDEAGRIFVAGDLTLLSGTDLRIDIGTAFVGTGYDQVDAAGTLTIAPGTVLTITTTDTPSAGLIYLPMVFAARIGEFSSIQGLEISSTMYYRPFYTATAFGLEVVQVPSPGVFMPLLAGCLLAVRRRTT